MCATTSTVFHIHLDTVQGSLRCSLNVHMALRLQSKGGGHTFMDFACIS